MKTITTIEQLEALPDRAVIKAADETILFCIGSGQPDWDGNVWQDEESRWIGSHDIDLPAALLHPLISTADDVEKAAEAIWDRYAHTGTFPAGGSKRKVFLDDARTVLATIGEVEA